MKGRGFDADNDMLKRSVTVRRRITGDSRLRLQVVLASCAVLGLAGASAAALASSAIPTPVGTFIPVTASSGCSLAAGFAAGAAASCSTEPNGARYLILRGGTSLSYTWTVPSGSVDTLTYGTPAGDWVNNVPARVRLDHGAPVILSSHLGPWRDRTSVALALWSSDALNAGVHTWTITSRGDAADVAGLWVAEAPAQSNTGDYPYATATCQATGQVAGYCPDDNWVYRGGLFDKWGYNYRNCTSWVAWRLSATSGYQMPYAIGDASAWGAYFANHGHHPGPTPTRGAIAWEPNGDHVAYVESVSSDGSHVTISEYNEHYTPGAPTDGSGTYDTRTVPAGDFLYIHVKDL